MNDSNIRPLLSEERSEREKVRLLAIGSREGVTEVIHALQSLGYVEAGAWSPLLPAPHPGEVMSILTRHRQNG